MSVTLDEEVQITPGLFPNGRPDPAYAAAIGLLPASAGRRSAAFAIDAAIFVILSLPVVVGALPLLLGVMLSNPVPEAWFSNTDFRLGLIFYAIGQGLTTIFVVVQLIMHGLRGLTVGKRLLGLRSVHVATFAKPGFWRIVVRALVFSAAFTIIPYLGVVPFLLSPLWDREKRGRGWFDRISRSWLVDIRHGLDPFDVKRMRHARKAFDAPVVDAAVELPSLATGSAWSGLAFVPSSRSSSGVISAALTALPEEPWEPPFIATPTSLAAPLPAPAAPAASDPAVPAATSVPQTVLLVFDDGLCLDIDGGGLMGRGPEAPADQSPRHLLNIDDPSRLISKTHLEFGIDEGGFWIADRGSGNGTFVTPPAGESSRLDPRTKTWLSPNSLVELGTRSFTVTVKDPL